MAINPKITLLDLYSDPNSFQFQSKNLKYDKDIRGGGYSGQPFIKRVAPKNNDNLDTLTTEALSLDYPIRGGSYEELAAREDFARIDRFLLSYPRGKAFLDKQRGLMLSNPKIPMAKSGGLFANRAYSDGRNLMTQIADAGTGIRNPNAGEDVFVLERFENKYEYITATTPAKENRLVLLKQFKLLQPPQTTASSINQLGTIFQSLGDTVSNLVNQSPSVSPNVDASQERAAFNYGINTVTTGELFNYPGGPGSLYGIVSNTTILRGTNSRNAFIDTSNAQKWIGSFSDEDNRTSITKNVYGEDVQGRPIVDLQLTNHLGVSKKYNLNATLIGINANNESETLSQQSGDGFIRAEQTTNQPANETIFKYTMGYDTIRNQNTSEADRAVKRVRIKDFRADVMDPKSVQSRDYEKDNVNIATRVGIGNPGSRPEKDRTNTKTEYPGGQDQVNMSAIQKNIKSTGIGPFKPGAGGVGGYRDLIKFGFDVVNINNPSLSNFINFRAFLTGYNDNHSAEWGPKRYSGRGENFYTYQGFERQVGFNFKIAAQSKQEMKPLYNKLNYLVSTLYPNYNSAGAMRGNIVKLTIGDLFYRCPGILTSLNLTIDDDYPWEIAFDSVQGQEDATGGSDKGMYETPQIMDVAATFIPILDVLPQVSFDIDNQNNFQTPIIMTRTHSTGSAQPVGSYLTS
tara:strand:- start:247 stop:2304 length:2058 start_codon:yes stop_codon:yes gene_type:complete